MEITNRIQSFALPSLQLTNLDLDTAQSKYPQKSCGVILDYLTDKIQVSVLCESFLLQTFSFAELPLLLKICFSLSPVLSLKLPSLRLRLSQIKVQVAHPLGQPLWPAPLVPASGLELRQKPI